MLFQKEILQKFLTLSKFQNVCSVKKSVSFPWILLSCKDSSEWERHISNVSLLSSTVTRLPILAPSLSALSASSFPGSFKPFLSIDIWEHFTFLFWHLGTAACFLCTLCSFRRSSPQLSDLSSEDLPNFSNTPSKALPLFIFLKSRYPVTFLSYCTFIWQ